MKKLIAIAIAAIAFSATAAELPKVQGKPATPTAPTAQPANSPEQDIAKKQIEKFDLNKDGKVSLEEFLAMPKEMFNQYDLNKDGYITAKELTDAMKQQAEVVNKARQQAANAPTPAK